MKASSCSFVLAAVVGVATACGGSTAKTPAPGAGNSGGGPDAAFVSAGDPCILNSDCGGALVCIFKQCHLQCAADRDCPVGERCVVSQEGPACALPDENRCVVTSDCQSPLVCAADGQCRSQCLTDRDCVAGETCSSGGACM